MRRLADYTIGLVIVLAHFVVMSWNNERVQLPPPPTRSGARPAVSTFR